MTHLLDKRALYSSYGDLQQYQQLHSVLSASEGNLVIWYGYRRCNNCQDRAILFKVKVNLFLLTSGRKYVVTCS
jgi:hypothetical protein